MDDAFEKWLREEVTATYDDVKNNPGLLMGREEFMSALERDLQRLVNESR